MSVSSQVQQPFLSLNQANDFSHTLSPVAHTTAARAFNTVANKSLMPSLLSCRVRGSGHRRSLFGHSEQMYHTKVGQSPHRNEDRDRIAVEQYLKGRSFHKKPGTAGPAEYITHGSVSVGGRHRQRKDGCVLLNKDDAKDRRINFLSAFSPNKPDFSRAEYLKKKTFMTVDGMMESRLEGTTLAIFENDQPTLASNRNLAARYGGPNHAIIQQQKADQLQRQAGSTPTRNNDQVFNNINSTVNTNSYGFNIDGGNLQQDSLDSIMSATAGPTTNQQRAMHTISFPINHQQRQRIIPPIKQNAGINNIFCSLERPREASLFRNQGPDGNLNGADDSSSFAKKSIASKKASETLTSRSMHSQNSRPTVASQEEMPAGGISERTPYQLHAFTNNVPTKVQSVQNNLNGNTNGNLQLQARLHTLNVDQYETGSIKSTLRSQRRSSHVRDEIKEHFANAFRDNDEPIRIASSNASMHAGYQSLCSDITFKGKATLINMRKFSVIPDDHSNSPKQCQFKFNAANNRLAINRIKLFDGVKNLEEMGMKEKSSTRGSIINKNTHLKTVDHHLDTQTHAHSIIESLRASKAALASGMNQSQSTQNNISVTDKVPASSGMGGPNKGYFNPVSSQQHNGSPTPDLISSRQMPGSSQQQQQERDNQRDYVRVYNASSNGQRALTHHVTKRKGRGPGNNQSQTNSMAGNNGQPHNSSTPEDESYDDGKAHDQSRMTEEQLENAAVEQAGDEDLMTDIDSTQYKRKLLRTGAENRDQLGFKPVNQLPELPGEMIPGSITPPLNTNNNNVDVKPPLTDEEAKFSTYQFESQMTFKNALAGAGTGLKLSQVTETETDREPIRKNPKHRFTPGVFHNLFKHSQ